ncbi:MAG: TolC family protein [Bacteroidales bacterium]|nr:TolC family protein [Bacteroidales bacterium]
MRLDCIISFYWIKKPAFGLLILFLSFISLVMAQDKPLQITLDEAIKIARLQSPDALTAKHQFRASYWMYRSFRASYLPSLTLFGTVPGFDRSIRKISTIEGDIFTPQTTNEIYAGLSLEQRIGVTGGTLSLNSNLTRLDNFTDTTNFTQYSSSLLNVTYRQPIFQYNEFKWQQKIEPMKFLEAKKKYLQDMEQVSVSTTNYFFNLLQAQIQEKIAIINQANYDTLYQIAKGRYNLGKIAENDLLQLELQYLRANATVEDARLNVDNQMFRFKSYLRIKEDTEIILIIPDDFQPFKVNPSKAIEEARINNAEALAFDRRLMEAESAVAEARLDGRFDAELFAVYGLTNNTSQIEYINKNPLDQQQFSLGISLPILDWGVSRGRIKMAQSNQEIVRTAVEQEQIDFDQEIFLKVARFNMQYEQVLIAAKSDTVAQKGYDITKARYLIGKISITDLNIAQSEANSSKGNYISVLWTYWRSFYEIRQFTLFDFEINMPIMVDYNELL